MAETRWVIVEGECEWCVLVEPHAHSVKPDGTLGVLVARGDQLESVRFANRVLATPELRAKLDEAGYPD